MTIPTTTEQKKIPIWIIIVSGLFAIMEVIVSVMLIISPESVLETVDLSAKGVDYIIYMWAARQFALGVIFGFSTLRKSVPMLTLSYIFFFVMFVGDFLIGISQNENSLIISAVIMCAVSATMIYFLNGRK